MSEPLRGERCRMIRYGKRREAPAGHDGPHYNGRMEWDDSGRRWS